MQTVVRELLPRASTNENQISQPSDAIPDLDLSGARRNTLNRPSVILDLRRKYTGFRARSYVEEESQRLSANSSRERGRIATKLSQPKEGAVSLSLNKTWIQNSLVGVHSACPTPHRSCISAIDVHVLESVVAFSMNVGMVQAVLFPYTYIGIGVGSRIAENSQMYNMHVAVHFDLRMTVTFINSSQSYIIL